MTTMQHVLSLPDVDWPEAREFWEGCRQGQLRLPRCRQCGRYHWYKMPVCPCCQSSDLGWVAVSGRASLFTWTAVRYAFAPALADVLPLLVGLVAPDEAPEIRLITNVVDCEEEDLRIGMPVEVVFRAVSDAVTMPFFRLAN